MKRNATGMIFLLAMLAAPWLVAQPGKGLRIESEDSFLEPLQERDSVLIGDQLRYGFHLKNVAEGTRFGLADLSQGFRDSIVVVAPWTIDTVKVHGKKKEPKSYDIDVSMIITSFDEGSYRLPDLPVVRAAGADRVDTLLFKGLGLEVRTMPVDTTTYQIHDIKGQIKYPLSWMELLPYVLGTWLVAIVAILIWIAISMGRKRDSSESARRDPAHVVALRKLDHFRGSKYWAPEKQKIFYSGITDALREYIDARYGIGAPEMPTAEMLSELKRTDVPAELYEEMKNLFGTADMVKFAKAFATDEENAAALPASVRFVTATYQSEVETDAREESGSEHKEGGAG